MRKNKLSGFSLIELLIVIAIIGLLASIILANLSEARLRSRDARRLLDIDEIKRALEIYFSNNSSYPASLSDLTTGCGSTPCLSSVPTDPLPTPGKYFYCKISTTSYHLGASLEDPLNSALKDDSDATTNPCPTQGGDAIHGNDGTGCDQASGRYCYDFLNKP